jgi:hypothetical protein
MQGAITFENITFIIALGGVVFGVYHFFRNPDLKNREEILSLKTALDGYKELNKAVQNLGDNHIHTIEKKVDGAVENISQLRENIVQLRTIIDERIPKK